MHERSTRTATRIRIAALVVPLAIAGACSGEESATTDTTSSTTTSTTSAGGAGGAGGSLPPQVRLPRESLLPSEVGVLVNNNDPASLALGSYYATARGIPAANVVALSLPVGDVATEQEFASAKTAADAALGANIQALVLAWTTPYRVDCMSITSAFALGFDLQYCSQPCNTTLPSAYYDSESLAPFTDLGVRPTMMLAASNAADAQALVDRGVAADQTFPLGDGYLVRTTDTARSVRYPSFQATVSDFAYPGGLALTYLDNSAGAGSDFVANANDVLFYFTGLASVPSIDTNAYEPGAVADHLTSYGGQVPTSGQMSVVAWLAAGVTGSYGTVVEPCNYPQKFPETRVLLPHYFRGETLVEAYWKSVHWPGEGLFVGEPLARPWGTTVTVANGAVTIRTTTLVPGKSYELRAATDAAGPYTAVQSNITVPHLQVTTLTIDPATAPFYELALTGT